MKLTDQEQVILKAIAHVGRGGLAEVSKVIKAVSYPKATTKKLLIGLSNKGVVSLHRHDYPASLTLADRKLMVLSKGHYFSAVSMRKRNPKGKHLAGATAKQQRQYEHILESAKEYGRYGKRKKEVAARTVRKRQNKSGKGKQALRTTGRALKKAASSVLGAGSQILGAGAKALNPHRRIKIRNKYIDLVIKGQAKKTPQGWKVGRKTFAQGRGTASVSSGYYLDRHTGMVYAKRERNKTKKRAKRRRNVAEGFYDASGVFHPIRSAADYSPSTASETGRKAKHTRLRKRLSAKRKASSTARTRSRVRTRKSAAGRLADRAIKRSSGLLKKRGRKNPSPESIRKSFAGSVSGHRDLYFPQGTPQGLAKLGKLVSITTEEGTIKPVHGNAWLCADTKERLHIGSTSPNPLFDGPKRSFGKVSKVEYEGSKPHLGYKGPIIWFHHMGEESGHRPTLHADGKGGLVFKGGNYRLTRRGIEN